MYKYIAWRILLLIPIVFLVSIIVFFSIHLIPGDVVDAVLGLQADAATRESLRLELGLDKPIIIQYFLWLAKLFKGDLGVSIITGHKVAALIQEKLPATLMLSVTSLIITILVAIPLGVIAASKQNSFGDFFALGTSLLLTSVPSFWLGIMLIIIFGVRLGILPTMGYERFIDNPLASLYHLILPALTLSAGMLGAVTRMTRSQMLEELGKDYIRTARAKGLQNNVVIWKHGLKNALCPVITVLGLQFGWTLGSAMVVEEIFVWPGIGRLAIGAIYSRDYPLLQGVVLIVTIMFLLVNLFVDIAYAFLDPRIRYEKQ